LLRSRLPYLSAILELTGYYKECEKILQARFLPLVTLDDCRILPLTHTLEIGIVPYRSNEIGTLQSKTKL